MSDQADLDNIPGELCPTCGDIMPDDGSPCPGCRHHIPDDPHTNTIQMCPTCNTPNEQSWSLDGVTVCEHCWLEEGERCSGHPVIPPAPEPPIRQMAGSDPPRSTSTNPRLGGGGAGGGNGVPCGTLPRHSKDDLFKFQRNHAWKKDWHSTCLMCATIFYDTKIHTCRKCGGHCTHYTSRELVQMERHTREDSRQFGRRTVM